MPRTPKTREERHSGYIRPHIQPGAHLYDQNKNTYKARFSQVYKPAGLDFVKAYDVIYKSYWLKFRLFQRQNVSKKWIDCGYDAINLYNFLNYLSDNDLRFTLRGLAYNTKQSQAVLVDLLDVLENAELISRVSMADMQGKPKYYVMRTPMFESPESLTDKVKERIKRAGDELPTVFVVDKLAQLARAIKENHAKQRRDHPDEQHTEEARIRRWNALLAAFDGERKTTVIFDRIVADVVALYAGRHLPLDAFDKIIRAKCKKEGIALTPRLRSLANENRAFYESYHKDIRPASGLPTSAGSNLDDHLNMLRDLLDSGWTAQQIQEQFAQSFNPKDWAKIEKALYLSDI